MKNSDDTSRLMPGDLGDLTITLELDDGSSLTCDVLTIFSVDGKQQYIALLPQSGGSDDVFLYRYSEEADGQPILGNIDSDDEFEAAADRFDEILDEAEYDEWVAAEGEEE